MILIWTTPNVSIKLNKQSSHHLALPSPLSADVAVSHPDKKSIIMYVTSLFQVLPQGVSMEAIEEVETLPRPASTTVMRVTTEQHYEIQTQQRFSQQVTHFYFGFRATVNENTSLFRPWTRQLGSPLRDKHCGFTLIEVLRCPGKNERDQTAKEKNAEKMTELTRFFHLFI